jgi:predicted AlkP superfamily phosphohydrolase/phosphomutase
MIKVLILGIDALDSILVEKFKTHLPNISKFRQDGHQLKVHSTFPPDSDTAWATIMTGLNPAQHGIVRFIDPLEKSYQILNQAIDNSVLHGKTFWELLGHAGFKTYALFPHLCYPIWEMPGVIVARGSNVVDVQASPKYVLDDYPEPGIMMGVRGFPDRTTSAMSEYNKKLNSLASTDADFALKLLKKNDWGLFFIYWSTIDAIGHFFWNYCDREDPNYRQGNNFENVILDTYMLYDDIVGRFLQAVSDDTIVFILSDHGHGARPYKLVNINEILRMGGYLKIFEKNQKPYLALLEHGKRSAVKFISRYGLGRVAGQVMRNFPGIVQSFTRPSIVDWKHTLAYASDMSGIKSYSYGGILLNKEALVRQGYERVRDEIISLILKECVLPDGTSLVKSIFRREELYTGPHIDKYPDILLELVYGYGLGWDVNVPLLTIAASYNLVPGSHRGDTGIFIIQTSDVIRQESINLLDVFPSLLDIFGLPIPDYCHGRSILKSSEAY